MKKPTFQQYQALRRLNLALVEAGLADLHLIDTPAPAFALSGTILADIVALGERTKELWDRVTNGIPTFVETRVESHLGGLFDVEPDAWLVHKTAAVGMSEMREFKSQPLWNGLKDEAGVTAWRKGWLEAEGFVVQEKDSSRFGQPYTSISNYRGPHQAAPFFTLMADTPERAVNLAYRALNGN